MKRFLKYILFVFFLYVFLFDPPIKALGELTLYYLLCGVSLVSFFIYRKELNFYRKLFYKEYTIFLIILAYSFIRSGLEGDSTYIIRHLLCIYAVFWLIPWILSFARRTSLFTEDRIIRSILFASAIAGSISMICVLVPSVDDFIRNRLIQYSEEDRLYGSIVRNFGWASGLSSSYGYTQGLMVAIGLIHVKKNKWFIPFFPVVFFSSLVNARTGSLITIWGIGAYLFFSRNVSNKVFLLILFLLAILYFSNLMGLFGLNEDTVAWISDFGDQMSNVASGDLHYGTVGTLLEMVRLPSGVIEWIIGKGIPITHETRAGINMNSDVGWIVQLNYGGIIYISLLLYAFVLMARRLLQYKQTMFMLILIGTIAIINTKGKVFPTIGGFPFIMFLYFIQIMKLKGILREE